MRFRQHCARFHDLRHAGRVTALALALAWAGVAWAAGPAAADVPRPDPNACQLLSNDDLGPLLFDRRGGVLNSWNDHPAPGESTCRWEAHPRERAATAAPRAATLAFYPLADAAHAHAQLAAQPHGDDALPSSALDGRGDDELVRSAPAVIVARHGADLAVLDARGAELSDPNRSDTRYLLDALTLKAAGATVRLPPPDALAWSPPANPEALTSRWLLWPLHLAVFVLRHAFLMLFAGIFGPIALGAVLARKRFDTVGVRERYLFAPLGLAALVANLALGDALADQLLHRVGVAAAATITGSYGTSTQYNNHDVVGYNVLVRAPGGTLTTSFEDDDFNVYPPHNATRYPGEGDVFTVRYLSGFPGDLTIVADDGSPWAFGMRCAALGDAAAQAERRAGFSENVGDRDVARRAEEAASAAHCPNAG